MHSDRFQKSFSDILSNQGPTIRKYSWINEDLYNAYASYLSSRGRIYVQPTHFFLGGSFDGQKVPVALVYTSAYFVPLG